MDTAAQRNGIAAVVVDLAGTTVDYGSCAPAGAFIEVFACHGVAVTSAQARGPMGLHKRDHIRALLEMPSVAEAWVAAAGRPHTEDDIDALYDEFVPLQLKCLPHYTALIPGTLEAVGELRRLGIRVIATTGYTREMSDLVLAAAADQGFVPDASVCAPEVRQGRPAPWMIFRGMEHVGVWPPAAVVKVGDTLPDIEAGVNAGALSVGVTRSGNMLGLPQAEVEALDEEELARRLLEAEVTMYRAGAHHVADDLLGALPWILERAM
jgi:phosphonoacetaldehyde hydrolase